MRKKSKVEVIKENSNYLRGPLAEEMENDEPSISKEAYQILKFHGSYQQDDRDLRKGRDKHWMFMIRGRIPGGRITAGQYLAIDDIVDQYGDGTIRATTRQTFQLYGVIKKELKATLQDLNRAMITTVGACGDIVRNVMATPVPDIDGRQSQAQAFADRLSDELLPATNAYHEIFLDGEKVYSGEEEVKNGEPLYGKDYLPRKFKIAVALQGDNSVDLYTQDIGLVAFFDESNTIEGFNVVVGGGMGMHHKKESTFPRLGDHIGYIPAEKVSEVVKEIIAIQRDNGDRKNRKQARMKYLIHNWGIEKFKAELEERLGYSLEPFRDMPKFELNLYLGWHQQSDGKWFLGLSIENGRIKDDEDRQLKTGLRKTIEKFQPEVRFTPNHNLLLTNIAEKDKAGVDKLLREHGIVWGEEYSNLLKLSMACPALPTCGLAITESERVFPDVIRDLESVIHDLGLEDENLSVRMTGCPNGCARPYVADIGFVGQSLNKYSVFIGGDPSGTRLNSLYKELVPLEDLISEVTPLLRRYSENRNEGESFGDFYERTGLLEEAEVAE
ncbi:NADPH-dependent assimilatory sulfite reductase hemoprotein subunit [Rhodohalobacter sp. SW132]|uniref:NADPH-dependent assimilatory sulfite reductase hemoprotein subunit n=1 Tax=Rhodohalobacter sp. SW132 TaxID=2293433 RepID=UPI000E25189C|nr:NADPH-dependent assimilatory sulfite reductase hemoprotein subunit [Rhodohalobacter sp. SW132]REL33245.1 NADPH-dependent assimilatory sulfite reductase hemoprotein subunit [Rhodohalobacter sp. SW132]